MLQLEQRNYRTENFISHSEIHSVFCLSTLWSASDMYTFIHFHKLHSCQSWLYHELIYIKWPVAGLAVPFVRPGGIWLRKWLICPPPGGFAKLTEVLRSSQRVCNINAVCAILHNTCKTQLCYRFCKMIWGLTRIISHCWVIIYHFHLYVHFFFLLCHISGLSVFTYSLLCKKVITKYQSEI